MILIQPYVYIFQEKKMKSSVLKCLNLITYRLGDSNMHGTTKIETV